MARPLLSSKEMRRAIGFLLATVLAIALGASACASPAAECNLVESCPCDDGTTQLAGCQEPATCKDTCASHGGACPSDFNPECDCACGGVAAPAFSDCTVLASTCETACEPLGGIAEAGTFDGSCPNTCTSTILVPTAVKAADGAVETCFCSGSCGCFAKPDGGASCP